MLGTPDETIWPGVTQLPDYKSRFPKWGPTNLDDALPTFDDDAKDLLSVRTAENAVFRGHGNVEFYTDVFVFYVSRNC